MATLLDVSVASNRTEKNSGTRIAVFHKRKSSLLAVDSEFLDDAELVAERVNRGMTNFLQPYLGPALVLEIPNAEISALTFIPIVKELIQSPEPLPSRLLIKSSWKAPSPVPRLTLDAVQYLHGLGIVLLGVDWPYLDNTEDVAFLLEDNDMVWLVNLDLSKITAPDVFFLSALPIRTDQNGETACRAILIPSMTN